ncbi:MAG: hypothetical protein FJ249_11165 [Nitrospira sp.]|nr:hypothetical protein [Nitrospira sp.]
MTGKRWTSWFAVIVVLLALTTGLLTFASAAETGDKPAAKEGESKKGSLRVQDLPKPIPQVMDKIKEVGNEVGKGISKAASEGAKAVNKAVKGDKDKKKEK